MGSSHHTNRIDVVAESSVDLGLSRSESAVTQSKLQHQACLSYDVNRSVSRFSGAGKLELTTELVFPRRIDLTFRKNSCVMMSLMFRVR